MINFQGKIVLSSNSTNIPNGTYNMEFKIYSGGDGVLGGGDETLLWTEDHLRSSGTGVTITDGIFQVNLGSVTALPGSVDFNNPTLWLSMNLGDTTTSCTPFGSCNGDGEMSPFVRFTAAPYAFNSDTLDGLDSTAFGQLSTNNVWTGTQTLQPTTNITSAIIKQTSAGSPTADILDVLTANNTNVIQVTGPAANEAAVTINSVGATRDLTLDSGSGTLKLGSNTTTLQKSGTAFTFDINSASNSTLTVTNAGAGTASLSVEGGVTIGAGQTYQVNGIQISSADLSNDSSLAKLNATQTFTGPITLQNASNSTSAFSIQTAGGSPDTLLTADTTNNRLIVGNATASSGADTTLLVVDSASSANQPTGVNGGIYYDTSLNKFQCYQNNVWSDCLTNVVYASSTSTLSLVSGLANVTANQTGLAVESLVFTSATAVSNTAGVTGFTAAANGSFRSCLIKNNANITAGTLALRWRVNGVSVGSPVCNMDSTAALRRQSSGSLDSGVVTFSAGDTIGIAFDTSATYAPTTADYTVFWSVEYNSTGGNALNLQYIYDSSSSPALITTSDAKDLQFGLADTATDANFLVNAATNSTGKFAVQYAGTDVLSVAPGSGDITLGNTAGGTITIGATSGTNLILQDADWGISGTGAGTFASVNAGSGTITTTGTIGTAGATTFTGAGGTFTSTLNANGGISLAANQSITTTAGTGSLILNSAVTNASDDAITINPSYTGGATDLLTYNAINIAAFSPTNASGTDTVNGLNIGNLTDPGGTINSTAVNIGSGWDTLFGGTTAGANLLGFTNFTVTSGGAITGTSLGTGSGNITTTGTVYGNTFDRTTTGTLAIGASAVAHTINLGTDTTTNQTISLGSTGSGNATSGTTVNLQGGTTANTAVVLGTNGAGGITVDTGTTGAILIGAGTGNNAKTITIGPTATKTSTTAVNIGTNAAGGELIAIGSNNSASTFTLETGTATATLFNGATAHTVQFATGAAIQNVTIGSTNTTSALTLQGGDSGSGNHVGINLLTGGNGNIQIGTADTTGTLLILDTKTNAGDPTGYNGAMYYNSSANSFRCYENGAWKDCITSTPSNASVADQAIGASTTAYLTNSNIAIPSSGLQAGTTFIWRITMSKTGAGTAANTFNVRFGTNGTTADASVCALTQGTQTNAADTAIVEITVTVRSVSTTGVIACNYRMTHNLPTTGFDNASASKATNVTSGAFNNTVANSIIGISYTTGASYSITVQQVQVTTTNL